MRQEGDNMQEAAGLVSQSGLYELDEANRDQLIISAPLAWEWSRTNCAVKDVGGMEEWAKRQRGSAPGPDLTCAWYHGTWQFLRLLNMVAVPPWYEFYHEALVAALLRKPDANVLISGAADYGMLCTLHQAVLSTGMSPTITLVDICRTPIIGSQWYAERNGFSFEYACANLLTDPRFVVPQYDLIVTDEFLTVLKDDDKPLIVSRWLQALKPRGRVVTTAMMGAPTTPELRQGYAARALAALDRADEPIQAVGMDRQELVRCFEQFGRAHTRHMLTGEAQVRTLFADFTLEYLEPIVTPGECVNPTTSFQIVASKR
jgi:2-polyprenyl-3-methyl-5-hydroxy-6-metoxy-1,4-benzoquinol methylase